MGVAYHLIVKEPETKKVVVLKGIGDRYGREAENHVDVWDQFFEDWENVDNYEIKFSEICEKKLSDLSIGDLKFLLEMTDKWLKHLSYFPEMIWLYLNRRVINAGGELTVCAETEYENKVKQQLIDQGYGVIELF